MTMRTTTRTSNSHTPHTPTKRSRSTHGTLVMMIYSVATILLFAGTSEGAFQTRKAGRAPTRVRAAPDDLCGPGFHLQSGPDGDSCVFDFAAAAQKFGTDQEHQVEDPDHYWEEWERHSQARKKFGLKPLSPAQYAALQAENHAIGSQQLSDATAEAFALFDADQDGAITIAELQKGLETILRTELSETSVEKVMAHFDTSGDGLLQPDEFVTLDQLRNQLATVTKEEQKQLAAANEGNGAPGLFQTFLQNLAFQFEDTCESNFDCEQPEVCCDLGYKKMCCSSGKMANDLQLQYATVPVPQGY
jgi:hypothetical protein